MEGVLGGGGPSGGGGGGELGSGDAPLRSEAELAAFDGDFRRPALLLRRVCPAAGPIGDFALRRVVAAAGVRLAGGIR